MPGLFDLSGRVAIVSGASSGLGADAARAYAQAGAAVALLARRKDRLDALAVEIEAAGGRALAVRCDVTDETSCRQAVSAVVAGLGRPDILLNNAGVAVRGGVETLSQEDWDLSFDVNVKGAFLMSKAVIGHMKEAGWGRIVNISSVNAAIADKSDVFIRHSYNASKAALIGLTRGMAASYARHGVCVNAIGPGLFESEMTADTLFCSEPFLAAFNALNPSGRPGGRGELNGPILFLSSQAATYVQGQFLLVDGGATLV